MIVADEAMAQEKLKAWILNEVQQGASLIGMGPLKEENLAQYHADQMR